VFKVTASALLLTSSIGALLSSARDPVLNGYTFVMEIALPDISGSLKFGNDQRGQRQALPFVFFGMPHRAHRSGGGGTEQSPKQLANLLNELYVTNLSRLLRNRAIHAEKCASNFNS
jgi:hypothetical protein